MKFLITAGPTREPIDPVRFLSNRSSGKMGYALAEAAIEAGHEVTLVSGPVCLVAPAKANLISVSSNDEMFAAVTDHAAACDVLIMCAAVADYKPVKVTTQKIKKDGGNLRLELTPTRDILRTVSQQPREFLVVGFAAETTDLGKHAREKLRNKGCDAIVANDVSGPDAGMESDQNEVTVFFSDDKTKRISRAPKKIIARDLIKIFSNMCEKRLTKKM